jgi:serine/threonine protein phosphatase PrpC
LVLSGAGTSGRVSSLFKSWGQSDIGLLRDKNEDAFWCGGGDGWHLALVADGMGGHQAGEVASRLAVQVVTSLIQELACKSPVHVSWQEELVAAVKRANQEVFTVARSDPRLAGMGTTLTVLLVQGRRYVLAHVGDSRAYRLRQGKLEVLTEDHSLVQELVNQGSLDMADARVHPQRHVLTRALGTEPTLAVDGGSGTLLPGDAFLLCTDGLTNAVPDNEILSILSQHTQPTAVEELIRLANKRGGRDNITVVLLQAGEDC